MTLMPSVFCVPIQAAEKIAAEAQVSAVTPPVKLTLQVYKTKLRRHMKTVNRGGKPTKVYDGEPLWVRLGITNIGKNTIMVTHDLFTGGREFGMAIDYWHGNARGIDLQIIGPDGKKVPKYQSLHSNGPRPGPSAEEKAAEHRLAEEKVAAWRRAGYSTEKINELLDEFSEEEGRKRRDAWQEENIRRHPAKYLKPGQSVWTPPYSYKDPYNKQFYRAEPIGDFSELANFDFNDAGIYRIRFVYDKSVDASDFEFHKNVLKDAHWKPDEWDVWVQTPWIKIEVLP